jgi:hypothetical protein
MFKNKVLWKTFGPNRYGVRNLGDYWYIIKISDVCRLPSIVRVEKS